MLLYAYLVFCFSLLARTPWSFPQNIVTSFYHNNFVMNLLNLSSDRSVLVFVIFTHNWNDWKIGYVYWISPNCTRSSHRMFAPVYFSVAVLEVSYIFTPTPTLGISHNSSISWSNRGKWCYQCYFVCIPSSFIDIW